MPEQICVPVSMEAAEDFHPRRCSTVKTYEYRIYNARMPDPMKRLYTYFSRYRFDVDAMREAAEYLVGEHDFKSFCSTYSSAKTTVREVLSVQVEEVPCGMSYQGYTVSSQTGAAADGTEDESRMPREIVIRVSGRGFLYNMVRIMAGTLMEVGRGLKKPGDLPEILQACDRRAAGATAPACGLTLVRYEILEPGYEMVFGSKP